MTEPKTFVSKPVKIKAMQTAPLDPMVAEKDREEQNRLVAQWVDSNGGEVVTFSRSYMIIGTLEGEMTAMPGDWIIQGTIGEFYPCKPEVFAAKYELVVF